MSSIPLKFLVDEPKFDLECIIEEKNANTPQTLFINGVFMVCNEKNKNGRIYQMNEMQTEVQRYTTEMVDTKRALGELNHPSCLTVDGQILTKEGWKYIKDISTDEVVQTLNPNTTEIEFHKIIRKIDEPYKGKMLRFVGLNIDLTVTPNHKIPLIAECGKFSLVEAQKIALNRKYYNNCYIPKVGTGLGEDTSTISLDEHFLTIEEVDYDGHVYCVEVPNNIFYAMENGKSCWTGNSIDINPERASHLVTKLWQEGNLVYGKAKILNTPVGNVVKSLIMEGVQLGVSSRALGKLNPTDAGNLVTNFHLVGIDIVHDPSAKAFVQGVLESKAWIINPDGSITEALETLQSGLKTMPIGNRDEYIRNLVVNFLRNIK